MSILLFKGKTCDLEVDVCELFESKGVKVCGEGDCFPLRNETGYYCECPKGFTGKECELELNECEPNPCQNNARCIDLKADFACICQSGFEGRTCEEQISECKECSQAGTEQCFIDMNVQQCKCKPNYTGKNCESLIEINECETQNPCVAGAKCIDLPEGFKCECPSTRTGKYCQIKLNFCHCNFFILFSIL